MKRFLLLLTTLLPGWAFTPSAPYYRAPSRSYPQQYFQSPVSHKLLLSGTFGELRPNHFHAGLDIRSSKGVAGNPVRAAADGYVSRIKVEESGYGNSIAIAHPNGYTTLYAHLDKFSPDIEAYVKEQQYAQQSFKVELNLGFDQFPVEQGQQVASMGNTGASNGAHLHFEVRDTKTQNPINPLLFGLDVTDNLAPRMHSLKVYALSESREEQEKKALPLLPAPGGGYKIKGDTLAVAGGQAGFALKVFDHFNGVSNWNGIYALSMLLDDTLAYDFAMESFSFDETRFINAHCDYLERVTRNSYYNRCYTLPGNACSIYSEHLNCGVLKLREGKPVKVTLLAADVQGNSSRLQFWVKRGLPAAPPEPKAPYNYVFPYNEGNMVQTDGLHLHMPPGTLYENLYFRYQATPDRSSGCYSDVHHIGDEKTPVHGFFDIGVRPTASIPAELKSKVFVAWCDGVSVTNSGGSWQGGYLRAKVRSLGNYCILADASPPSVKPVSFQPNMKGLSKMTFRIGDNVAAAPNVTGLTYDAWVDDQWILMEFDKKTATLSHRFDERIGKGEHNLRLVVKDAVGNETVLERKFLR